MAKQPPAGQTIYRNDGGRSRNPHEPPRAEISIEATLIRELLPRLVLDGDGRHNCIPHDNVEFGSPTNANANLEAATGGTHTADLSHDCGFAQGCRAVRSRQRHAQWNCR